MLRATETRKRSRCITEIAIVCGKIVLVEKYLIHPQLQKKAAERLLIDQNHRKQMKIKKSEILNISV